MKKLILTLLILLAPLFADAQLILPQGGTGLTSYTQGDLLYFNSGLRFTKLPIGSNGNCLTVTLGLPAWGTSCGSGSSSGGTWSTTTSQVSGQFINYPNETDDVVAIGSNASTTSEFYFDPNNPAYPYHYKLLGNLFGNNSSTTILNLTSTLSTSTQATSTNFHISSLFNFDSEVFDSLTDDVTLANNGGDLQVVDVTCTNCLTTTEVASADLATLATNVSDTDFGDLTVASGVWAVEDDSHAHTGASLSGVDISDDTNLAATWPIVLTGDTLSFTAGLDKWATSTGLFTNAIYPNGGVNTMIGIGTTTPYWQLQVSTTSKPQITISDSGTATSNHWSFRNAGGLFYLATSSPSTFATSTTAVFTINANGIPTFSSLGSGAVVSTAGVLSATTLTVANGGTGQVTLTDHGVLVGSGVSAVDALSVGTNGQLLVGSTGADPVFATLNCADGLTCTTGAGTLEIDFDGGDSPGGSLGGTWASPTIDDLFLFNNGDVGTGVYDFGGTTSFEITNGTGPTVDAVGEIAWDTTSGNLVIATSTTGYVVLGSATTTLYSATASTTSIISGTIIDIPSHPLPQTVTSVWCKVSSATSLVVNLSDGTNDTNAVTCTTTGTQYAITSNAGFTAYEAIRLEFGTKTGDTGYLSFRIMGYRQSD